MVCYRGSFDSPPFKYYCDYGGGSELCKRDNDGDGVKETTIIFSEVPLKDALSVMSSLTQISSNDFKDYDFLEKLGFKIQSRFVSRRHMLM